MSIKVNSLGIDSNNLTRKTRSDNNGILGFKENPKMAERNMKNCVCNEIKDILVSSLILNCENNRESGYVSEWTQNTPKKKDRLKTDSLQGKDTWKDKVWRFINLFHRKQKMETKEVSIKIYEFDASSTYASSLSCDCTSCVIDQIELKDASTSSSISQMNQQTQTENTDYLNDPQIDLISNESFVSKNDFMNFINEISSVSPISSEIEQCLDNYDLRDDFLKFVNEINKMPMPQEFIWEKTFSDVSIQTEFENEGMTDIKEKSKKRKNKQFIDSKNEFMEEYFVVHRKKVEYYETIARKSDSDGQKKNQKFPILNPLPNLADEFKKIRFKPVKLPPLEKSTSLNLERSKGEEILRTRKSRFCHECSAKYLPNAKYCSNCGIKRIIF